MVELEKASQASGGVREQWEDLRTQDTHAPPAALVPIRQGPIQ